MLVDLSHAADGFVGVAQDIRLIFAMLARLPGVAPTGLLMPQTLHDLPRITPDGGDQVALQAGIIHWMSRAAGRTPRRSRVGQVTGPLREVLRILRRRHTTLKLRPELLDAVWRVLFEQTLPPGERALIGRQDFVATDLSVARLLFRVGTLPRLSPVSLDAAGYDAVLFCNARPITLPPGVRTYIRYHDAIPLTDADMVSHWQTGAIHQRMVRECDPAAVFVCDSPSSVQDLALADPRRAEHARVIPCALAPANLGGPTIAPASIFAAHRVFRALGREPAPPPPLDHAPRYVLSVSTFEPRKNFSGLVRAWERVVARHDPDLRLVLVAGRGWLEEDGLRLIAPHVATGRLLHLQGLPPDELHALMQQAECFVFPSFAEGFGLPPLEALQAGASVVVSDIPVLRWTLRDAALFVDPYDVEDMAQAIVRLCVSPEREGLKASLRQRAAATVSRFTPATLAQEWAALLDAAPTSP